MSLIKNMIVKSLSFIADCPGYLMLFRKHVSRRAADQGRAVLEGVGLDAPTIQTCFMDHPQSMVEAVHAGLIKWSSGQGLLPTWEVLLQAMEDAEIAQQHIQELKKALGLREGMLSILLCMWCVGGDCDCTGTWWCELDLLPAPSTCTWRDSCPLHGTQPVHFVRYFYSIC